MRKCLFFFIICSFLINNEINAEIKAMNHEYIPARYVVLSEQITTEVAQKLSKKYDMEFSGSGGGLAKCVNILSLSFEKLGPLSKVELRKILVGSVEEFLSAINSNEELRPFLKNYPFTPKEIQIEIYIRDRCGREVYSPNIAIATAKDGMLSYKTVSKDDSMKFHSNEREGYEEALSTINHSVTIQVDPFTGKCADLDSYFMSKESFRRL